MLGVRVVSQKPVERGVVFTLLYALVCLTILSGVPARGQYQQGSPHQNADQKDVDRMEVDIRDLRVDAVSQARAIAALTQQVSQLSDGQAEMRKEMRTFLWWVATTGASALGGLVIVLVGVLWSLRRGWLTADIVQSRKGHR